MEFLNKLKKYEKDGLLRSQTHNTLPLTIWNYTEKVQYEGLWDDITLMCRGLVVDDKGTIVARPFKKFFNLEEQKHTSNDVFEVYEKMDGSLIIAFYYQGSWNFATRGSFHSEQAQKATSIFKNKYSQYSQDLHKSCTYMFEVIYPSNRVVVDYNQLEDLIMLGMVGTNTGNDYSVHLRHDEGWRLVKRVKGPHSLNTLKYSIKNNEEGYVVLFSNGERCKVKGEEYVRLHKIMTNLSTTAVWECLSKGDDISSILEGVPDEYFEKIKAYSENLKACYDLTEKVTSFNIPELSKISSRSLQAKRVFELSKEDKRMAAAMFANLDGNTGKYTRVLWGMVKPEFKKL